MDEFDVDIDLTVIISKLFKEGLARKTAEGLEGEFCISKHKHLLTDEEFDTFVEILHMSTPSHTAKCTGVHTFKFKTLDDLPQKCEA